MRSRKSGIALVSTMCILAIIAVLVSILMMSSVNHFKLSNEQILMEKAVYVAAGGVERAVEYIAKKGDVPATLQGTINGGSYAVSVQTSDSASQIPNGAHVVSGSININPNNSPDMEFTLTLGDGSTITRNNLTQDFPGYSGVATSVRVKPKGNGSQNSLMMEGFTVIFKNSDTYQISAPAMSVTLYNDSVKNGKALGKWWLTISSSGSTVLRNGSSLNILPADRSYRVASVGTFNNVSRQVVISGLRNMSWARFALWSDNNRDIYFKSGESFYGPVHSNSKLWFSGNPHFYDDVTSAASDYGGNTSQCIFDEEFELNVDSDSMVDVPFNDLLAEASSGDPESRMINGDTWVILEGDDMSIGQNQQVTETYTNSQGKIKTRTVTKLVYTNEPATDDELVYVKGSLHIKGELDGRRTFVTDGTIYIDDNLTYTEDPKVNPESDDALGLLTKGDIVVTADAPDDLRVYAHMMATGEGTTSTSDGSFYVDGYSSGDPRGTLSVHGGIIQAYRGAVGTFNPSTGETVTGFMKNYTFDERFSENPPPQYPALSDMFVWENWCESTVK